MLVRRKNGKLRSWTAHLSSVRHTCLHTTAQEGAVNTVNCNTLQRQVRGHMCAAAGPLVQHKQLVECLQQLAHTLPANLQVKTSQRLHLLDPIPADESMWTEGTTSLGCSAGDVGQAASANATSSSGKAASEAQKGATRRLPRVGFMDGQMRSFGDCLQSLQADDVERALRKGEQSAELKALWARYRYSSLCIWLTWTPVSVRGCTQRGLKTGTGAAWSCKTRFSYTKRPDTSLANKLCGYSMCLSADAGCHPVIRMVVCISAYTVLMLSVLDW